MKVALCPECEGEFRIGPLLKVGQRVTCPQCQAELEVIHLTPLELDWAFDEPTTDWDDEDEGWEDQEEVEEEEDWEDEEEWEEEEEEEL